MNPRFPALVSTLALTSTLVGSAIGATPAQASGLTGIRSTFDASGISWLATSRVVETTDVGKDVTVSVTPTSNATMACDSLAIGTAPSTGLALRSTVERTWSTSGCWTGEAHLVTRVTADMVGSAIGMSGTAVPAAGATSAAFTTKVTLGGQTTTAQGSVDRQAAAPTVTAASSATAPTATESPTATKSPAATTSSNRIVLTARTTIAGGVGAHLQVRVNGTVAGSTTLQNTTTAAQGVTLDRPTKVGDTIEVLYDNDATVGGVDRNVWIQQVTLADGSVLPATKAVIDAGWDWATASDDKSTSTTTTGAMWSNGAMRWRMVTTPVSTTRPTPTTTPTAPSVSTAPSAAPSTTGPAATALKPKQQVGALSRPMFWTSGTDAYWLGKRATDPTQKAVAYNIARSPFAQWYEGGKPGQMAADVQRTKDYLAKAKAQNQVAQIVLYGIPGRDCGLFSSGGLADLATYKTWIDQVSAAIGNDDVIVIIEPDAINYCGWAKTDQRRIDRGAALTYAGRTLHDKNPNAMTYLHAGSGQLGLDSAADQTIEGGIAWMRGFAMNVAGLGTTPVEEAWAEKFVAKLQERGLGEKAYVVDTGRNGVAIAADSNPGLVAGGFLSCNNPTAALGTRPTTNTTGKHADAYLWIKLAGNSDGDCHVGDAMAGQWMWSYATTLVNNSVKAGTTVMEPIPADYHA